WAEQRGFYDVAASRYYYALFQKALWFLRQLPGFKEPAGEGSSHVKLIQAFSQEVYAQLKDEEILWIAQFHALRKCRRTADYGHMMLTELEFKQGFKYKYDRVAAVVERVIGGDSNEKR